ncbi:dihydrofolate reductase family protein [Bosea sp. LjRoot237]|uniref:dihydrofolate reductase family protein n=1 Tax=Bosea sp. LjRoot237 TaxID=3342292 RepID=UPI003ECF33BF
MRKLVVTQYISLDGVIEDPVGMENSGLGDWTGPFTRGPEGERLKQEELDAADSLLLGRRTYEAFAAVWPHVTGSPFADQINALPKHLASTTLTKAEWQGTSILAGDALAAISALKEEPGRDILVYGSLKLVHGLQRAGLVDAYNLMVYPVALGAGGRLFADGARSNLALAGAKTLGEGIQWLRYEVRH